MAQDISGPGFWYDGKHFDKIEDYIAAIAEAGRKAMYPSTGGKPPEPSTPSTPSAPETEAAAPSPEPTANPAVAGLAAASPTAPSSNSFNTPQAAPGSQGTPASWKGYGSTMTAPTSDPRARIRPGYSTATSALKVLY